ncbi:STAS domain-containing protein [Paenibacillus sp.]|uniref:STAS domain-containing protein n=1 Tax=Paenibacillus sp. TaxID=58172 RepID=UPI00281A9414|nr:STAS domain-containing protein [Paenibacillus sp.]MDR0270944.1 STAS domain-containing protein [Paenibacillus sp.]
MNTNQNEKFNVTTERNEESCTVYLNGELDLAVAGQLRLVMEPLVLDSDLDLIINMRNLKYIDSTGIGILLSILKARHGMKARFVVDEVPARIQKLFDMTGIAKFLTPNKNRQ